MKSRRRKPARTRHEPSSGPVQPLHLLHWLGLIAALAIGILTRWRYFRYCIHDDAFISFRYARNLVRGDGLVMNPGERVEGFTNFLWTVAAAPGLLLGLDPSVLARVAGATCSLLLVLCVFVFTDRRLGGSWFTFVAPLMLLGNLAFAMESLSGLETMAFALTVFLAYVAFIEERHHQRWPFLWVAICGTSAVLRPEGILVFAVLWCWETLGGLGSSERSAHLRRAATRAGLFVLLLAPLFAWRLFYYHAWLPNTFYTKVGYTVSQVERGWRHTTTVFGFTMTLPLLVVAAVGGVLAWLRRRTPRDEAVGVAFALVLSYLAYVWAVGGDYEPTARFYMPVLAFVYLLFQEGLRRLASLLGARGRPWRLAAGALALLAFLWVGYRSEQRVMLLLNARGWPFSRSQHHDELRTVGDWLNRNTAPTTTLALSSIGALPYFADRPIIDMMGLTDPAIGRRAVPNMGQGPPGHEKGDANYVLSRNPDIVLFDKGHLFDHQASLDEVLAGARGISELGLANSPEFHQHYELQRASTPAGILHFFRRRP